MFQFSFFKFLEDKSFLWGHWYPCFVFVVTSLGFKARVSSLICALQRHLCYTFPEIHLWCHTSWPLGGQHGSQAVLFYIPSSRYWWGSKLGPIMPQTDTLPTELCRLGWCFNIKFRCRSGSRSRFVSLQRFVAKGLVGKPHQLPMGNDVYFIKYYTLHTCFCPLDQTRQPW